MAIDKKALQVLLNSDGACRDIDLSKAAGLWEPLSALLSAIDEHGLASPERDEAVASLLAANRDLIAALLAASPSSDTEGR
jgi:hypothetical protein